VAIIALVAGGGFFATRGGDSEQSAPPVTVSGEVLREPVTVPGPDPFTPTVTTGTTTSTSSTVPASSTVPSSAPPTTGGTVVLASTTGNTPGLYGGTRNNAECNKEALITFLEQNPDKARAWAQIQQIEPAQIRDFVSGLTPVLLGADTRVTNHGFKNGQPTPRQAVLEKGTAVLVDAQGVPRARCYCGNPLAPPVAQAESTTFTGPTWPAFDPGNLQVVTASPEPITTLELVDVATGGGIARPAGTDGTQDVEIPPPPPLPEPRSRPAPTVTSPPSTAQSTTAPPGATTSRPSSIPAPNAFIQQDGAVGASSEYSAEYPAALVVDGDVSTSWFSAGSQQDGPTTTFTWTYPRDEFITHIRVIGNGAHPEFPRGFGFGSVTIRVLDELGRPDFEQTVSLDGSPDPDALVQPGVFGRIIELTFSGGEAPDCGGFAELEVGVTR
jgi:hypothetical protein